MGAWQCLHYVRDVVSEKSEVSPSSNDASSDKAVSLTAAKLSGLEVRLLNGIACLVAENCAGKQEGPGNLGVGRAHPEAIIVPYIKRPRQANPSDLQGGLQAHDVIQFNSVHRRACTAARELTSS